MNQLGLAVRFTDSFMQSVHLTDKYFQEHNPARGQRFVRELFSLLYDVVATFPQSQPLFQPLCQRLPGREFRKAIFRRQYLAIYEVRPDHVCFVSPRQCRPKWRV
jgi:hypothetical protein